MYSKFYCCGNPVIGQLLLLKSFEVSNILPLDKILNFNTNENVKGAIKDGRVYSYQIYGTLQNLIKGGAICSAQIVVRKYQTGRTSVHFAAIKLQEIAKKRKSRQLS
jgi:hypothetical protein